MNAQAFATKRDALNHAVIPALTVPGASSPTDYDVGAIFAETFTWDDDAQVYRQTANVAAFWESVKRHAL